MFDQSNGHARGFAKRLEQREAVPSAGVGITPSVRRSFKVNNGITKIRMGQVTAREDPRWRKRMERMPPPRTLPSFSRQQDQ